VNIRRRRWLRLASAALAASAAGAALGQTPKRVDESDPQAQALGYRHDAAKADRAKFANYQPGRFCEDCNFSKGKAGDAWRPCDLFGAREVNAKGWCTGWLKKT
jgi:hypothetical protein